MTETAVLIIDAQVGIFAIPVERTEATRAAGDAVVARIAGLIGRARSLGVPVIYVQHDGPPGHPLAPGTAAWEIRQEIAPAAGEPVIHKSACDSFFETTLDAELKARGITGIIAAGCMTQYCVDTTVRRAVTMGYDVILAADGHMTIDVGALTFEQIIAHHNFTLHGLKAGARSVKVKPAAEVLA